MKVAGHRVREDKVALRAALCDGLEGLIASGGKSARWEILGNRIRVRVAGEELQAKVTGYVFTDELDPALLLK